MMLSEMIWDSPWKQEDHVICAPPPPSPLAPLHPPRPDIFILYDSGKMVSIFHWPSLNL